MELRAPIAEHTADREENSRVRNMDTVRTEQAIYDKILQAIIDRAPFDARTLMDEHLQEIEISIKLPEGKKDKVDLKKLFAER